MKVIEDRQDTICRAEYGKGGTGTSSCAEQQITMALSKTEDLTTNLMEGICRKENLNQAFKRVKRNKGAPGIDGMTVEELSSWIRQHKEQLISSLLNGSYIPQAVRGVEIPKPGSDDKRQLGIPCMVDRLVQQAIAQILEPLFDPTFSKSSYGFRPGLSAHHALKQASEYVKAGYVWVVDMDLEKFFDRVNHDILMSRLERKIKDKGLLKIIRCCLEAGIMRNGVFSARHEGTPQGGPLSPLLSNILLDELDKELERRGHKFCRYADDQNIYVRSKRAGERVYASIKKFLTTRLKLKVNEHKSAVALVQERKFLGYRIQTDGQLTMAPETKQRVKDEIRKLTCRRQGSSFEMVIKKLNSYLQGWMNYYKLCIHSWLWKSLDSWIRRKLRCYKLKQLKCGNTISKFLMNRGISETEARKVGSSGKGWWRVSSVYPVQRALTNAWFKDQGLIVLEELWARLVNT